MTTVRDVQLSHLRLDPANPRLGEGQQSQREALGAMMDAQQDKLVALARDIAKVGLNPLDRFLVIPAEDDPDEFVVLEGNRRLAALKLLLNPNLGSGALGSGGIKALKTLAPNSPYKADSPMECIVVDSRDDAAHWLRLRHGGQLDGAGTVGWGATERERFESRSGKHSPELQLIQFAVSSGAITDAQANAVAITNLRRLLSDKDVRKTVGIEIDRKAGKITTRFPAAEVLKPVRKLMLDLAADDFKVAKIYTKTDREDYLKDFGAEHRPKVKTLLPAAIELPKAATGLVASGIKKKKPRGRVRGPRRTVAPTTLGLTIDTQRIRDIYRELQRIQVEDMANAGAVLLRVFLELSVDRYISKKKLQPKQNDKLAKRLQLVHDHLIANGVSRAELAGVRKAISGKDLLGASIPLFNLYVHSFHLSPSPGDVRTAWDNLEQFFKVVWV